MLGFKPPLCEVLPGQDRSPGSLHQDRRSASKADVPYGTINPSRHRQDRCAGTEELGNTEPARSGDVDVGSLAAGRDFESGMVDVQGNEEN